METKTGDDSFLLTEISEKEQKKIQQDLEFVSQISKIAREKNVRVVIHGGYSVDGALGKITRPHKDIDIQLYGQSSDSASVVRSLTAPALAEIKDKGASLYYHNYLVEKPGFGADFYYIQVDDNPFGQNKTIIKNDGTKSEPHPYETHQVTLNGISFEATLPSHELSDKVEKKQKGEKERKEINQDIHNLEIFLGEYRGN